MGAAAARCRGGTSAWLEALQVRANPLRGEAVQGPQPWAAAGGMSLPQKKLRGAGGVSLSLGEGGL